MTAVIKNMERVFVYKKDGTEIKLDDIDPNLEPKDVMSFYANTYPELTTATVQGPEIKKDQVVYTFGASIGTKG